MKVKLQLFSPQKRGKTTQNDTKIELQSKTLPIDSHFGPPRGLTLGETYPLEPLRRSSAKIGTIQRRLAWPLRKDDTHKSRMYLFF